MESVTLSKALKDLETLLDQAVETGEPVVIKRKGKPDVAIVATADLPKPRARKSQSEHVLASPTNRRRIEEAFAEADAGKYAWSGTLDELKVFVASETAPKRADKRARKP